jgi:hypothetical protein
MTSTASGTGDLVVVDGETAVVAVDGETVVVDVDGEVVVEAAMPPLSPPHAAAVTPIRSKTADVLIHRRLSFMDYTIAQRRTRRAGSFASKG